MKAVSAILLLVALPATGASPITKVIQMIADLETKIIKEGESAQKLYEEFAELCDDRNKELGFEIKTGKAAVAELEASIDKETADISAAEAKIEELSGGLAEDAAELKSATAIREKDWLKMRQS